MCSYIRAHPSFFHQSHRGLFAAWATVTLTATPTALFSLLFPFRQDLPKLFAAVDADGNGTIDVAEFRAFVDGCLQQAGTAAAPLQQDDVAATFNYIDTDNSNDIDFDEFEYFFYVRHQPAKDTAALSDESKAGTAAAAKKRKGSTQQRSRPPKKKSGTTGGASDGATGGGGCNLSHACRREIARFLGQLRLSQYADAFCTAEIELEGLREAANEHPLLLDAWLKDIGVRAVGHRSKIRLQLVTAAVKDFMPIEPGEHPVATRVDVGGFPHRKEGKVFPEVPSFLRSLWIALSYQHAHLSDWHAPSNLKAILINQFEHVSLVSALFLTMVAESMEDVPHIDFVEARERWLVAAAWDDVDGYDTDEFWTKSQWDFIHAAYSVVTYTTAMLFIVSIIFALHYCIFIEQMTNLDELVCWSLRVGKWKRAPLFLFFMGIFGWLAAVLLSWYLRAWHIAESVWLIHVAVGVAVVVFATWVMVTGVRDMYAAKLSVATGAFRLKKRGHKHHEQFTKERSIELLLCNAANLPSMDANKGQNDTYCDVRLGESEHDYFQKGEGLGQKKYWRSPMIPESNNPVWFDIKVAAADDAEAHHVTTLSTTGIENPELHLRIYDQDTLSADDFIGECRIPVRHNDQGTMVATAHAIVDQAGVPVIDDCGAPAQLTCAWWRHTLHHHRTRRVRGSMSSSMDLAKGPRGSVTMIGKEAEESL